MRVEVAEVPVPRFHIAAPFCSAAVGRVTVQPSVGCDVEQCPVVAADAAGIAVSRRMYRVAGLPACGNSRDPAERDEEKCLYAAVAASVDRRVHRNVVEQTVFAGVGILDVRGHIVVDAARFDEGIVCSFRQVRRQFFQIRREHDVRLDFREIGKNLRRDFSGYIFFMEIVIHRRVREFQRDFQTVAGMIFKFRVRRADRTVGDIDRTGRFDQTDAALFGSDCREGEPYPDGFAGTFMLFVGFDPFADSVPPRTAAVFAHICHGFMLFAVRIG